MRSINERKTSGRCYKDKKKGFSVSVTFKEQLSLLYWRHSDFNGTVNEIYDTFLKTTDIYDANFPMREYILKDKDIKSPWICKGLKKSTKTKRLYINFLKTVEDESNYKN